MARAIARRARPELIARRVTPALRPRQGDWERQLVAWAASRVGDAFAWGTTDCAHLVAEALSAMTHTPAARILAGVPFYRTMRGAVKAERAIGGTAAYLRALTMREILRVRLASGDVLVTPAGEGDHPVSSAFVVAGARLLGVHPGDVVRWYPREHALESSVALSLARVSHSTGETR